MVLDVFANPETINPLEAEDWAPVSSSHEVDPQFSKFPFGMDCENTEPNIKRSDNDNNSFFIALIFDVHNDTKKEVFLRNKLDTSFYELCQFFAF